MDLSPKQEGRFIFVGRITRGKAIQHAIAALSKHPTATLDVVGPVLDNGYGEELRGLVAELHINSRVTFWGSVSDDVKAHLLRRSVALILPSKEEAQGIVLPEALIQETLPVAPQQGAGDFIRDCGAGRTYSYGRVAELAQILQVITDSPEKTRGEALRGKAWVEKNLDPDLVAGRVLDLYERALKTHRPTGRQTGSGQSRQD
jgi:glycosyltransferase involved in cell wall biosynthesis